MSIKSTWLLGHCSGTLMRFLGCYATLLLTKLLVVHFSVRATRNNQSRWQGKIFQWVWPSKWVQECRETELWEGVGYMNTSGNRDRQVAFITVLEESDDAVLTTFSWNLFQRETAWTLNACWQWRVSFHCLLSVKMLIRQVEVEDGYECS